MPIQYVCSPAKRLTIVVWSGNITLNQWQTHMERLLVDPDYGSMKLQLSDLRRSTFDPSITVPELEQAADWLKTYQQLLAERKIALVAGENFSKSELFGYFVRPHAITVLAFNYLSAACAWLGVEVAPVEQAIQHLLAETPA